VRGGEELLPPATAGRFFLNVGGDVARSYCRRANVSVIVTLCPVGGGTGLTALVLNSTFASWATPQWGNRRPIINSNNSRLIKILQL